jgi:hypothetical protein
MLPHTDPILPVPTCKRPCMICLRKFFDRQQELDRHIRLIHLPCSVFCPYSGCKWRGCRVDELQKHLKEKKCDQQSKGSNPADYRIYNVENILEMIREAKGNDCILKAQDWAVHFVRERAKELGKNEWFSDPWGCLEQRERRARLASRE